jgi:hypothetical protein
MIATAFADLDQIEELASAAVRPPADPPTFLRFAEGLTLPDGPLAGKRYQPAADPVHAALMRELDRGWGRIVAVGAVQTGKSLGTILVPCLRAVTALRQPVVYAQPAMDKLHQAWSGKVEPSIRGAGMGGWMPATGQGSRGGNTPKFVVFRDPITGARAGMIYLIPGGGKREGAQASVTASVVLVDEVDDFKNRHRVELIAKRADSYGSRALRIYTSTVKLDEGSIILGLYDDSTASRLWFACPHCGHYAPMEWERVSYDAADEATAAASVRIACDHCAVAWTEDDRRAALRSWRLVHRGQTVDAGGLVLGAAPATGTLGILWTALDSSLRDLPGLAIEHWRATRALGRGDHGPMRSFHRDQLCRPYLGDRVADDEGLPARISRAFLAARAATSDYGLTEHRHEEEGDSCYLTEMPKGVEFLIVTTDVQRGGQRSPGRLYYLVQGMDSALRTWDIGWGHVVCSPTGAQVNEAELHRGLDRLRDMIAGIEASTGRPVVRRGVDVGDMQDWVRRWLVRNPTWWAIKGVDRAMTEDAEKSRNFDISGWLYRREQDAENASGLRTWWLYLVPSDTVRLHAQSGLLLPAGAPGAHHQPRGLDHESTIIKHYCATALINDSRDGQRWSDRATDRKFHHEWQRRHDLLDCRTYGQALGYQYCRTVNRRTPKKRYGDVGNIVSN